MDNGSHERESTQLERMPRHVAIIMDGNGRWAQQRGLSRTEGHRRGERTVRTVIETSGELGIEHLTLFAFSAENWRRSQDEVGGLMGLIEVVARRNIRELSQNNVHLRILGRLEQLPRSLRRELDRDVALTHANSGLHLDVAINYGGRSEIVDACRRLAERVQAGELTPDEITETTFAESLYTHGAPDPDLLIRTGGEMRVSNFLLWQIAYSEIWVTETLWPDFSREHFIAALESYQARERRFGATPDPNGAQADAPPRGARRRAEAPARSPR